MGEKDSDKIIRRFEMVGSLLNENIDAFERRRLRAQILETSGLSERTLRRYLQHYKEKGYRSLADIPRSDKRQPAGSAGGGDRRGGKAEAGAAEPERAQDH